MENNATIKLSASQIWYGRLNRYLLFLVCAEFGYAFLILGALVLMHTTKDGISGDFFYRHGDSLMLLFLPFAFALVLNIIGGFISAVLHIISKHEGYPSSGHLLNWLVCITHAWFIILAILAFVDDIISTS
jgi:hypothetical protein